MEASGLGGDVEEKVKSGQRCQRRWRGTQQETQMVNSFKLSSFMHVSDTEFITFFPFNALSSCIQGNINNIAIAPHQRSRGQSAHQSGAHVCIGTNQSEVSQTNSPLLIGYLECAHAYFPPPACLVYISLGRLRKKGHWFLIYQSGNIANS